MYENCVVVDTNVFIDLCTGDEENLIDCLQIECSFSPRQEKS